MVTTFAIVVKTFLHVLRIVKHVEMDIVMLEKIRPIVATIVKYVVIILAHYVKIQLIVVVIVVEYVVMEFVIAVNQQHVVIVKLVEMVYVIVEKQL